MQNLTRITFGIAKGRNVIYVHLESFQQFLIDYKLQADGKAYEGDPFPQLPYHPIRLWLSQMSSTRLRLVRLLMLKP